MGCAWVFSVSISYLFWRSLGCALNLAHRRWISIVRVPGFFLTSIFGSRKIGAPTLTGFAFLYGFTRNYRSQPMPNQLEGFKLADRGGINTRQILWVMWGATVVGLAIGFVSFLHAGYRHGSLGDMAWTGGIQRSAALVDPPKRHRLESNGIFRLRYHSYAHDAVYASTVYLVAAASTRLSACGQLEFR